MILGAGLRRYAVAPNDIFPADADDIWVCLRDQ